MSGEMETEEIKHLWFTYTY